MKEKRLNTSSENHLIQTNMTNLDVRKSERQLHPKMCQGIVKVVVIDLHQVAVEVVVEVEDEAHQVHPHLPPHRHHHLAVDREANHQKDPQFLPTEEEEVNRVHLHVIEAILIKIKVNDMKVKRKDVVKDLRVKVAVNHQGLKKKKTMTVMRIVEIYQNIISLMTMMIYKHLKQRIRNNDMRVSR